MLIKTDRMDFLEKGVGALPKRKYDSQATMENILTVSARLFLEKGFDKTSMADIAQTAGISKGAIYHHFQSKDEIADAVAQRQAEGIQAAMESWKSEAGLLNGKEKLQFILERNIDSQQAHYLDDVMGARMKSAGFVLSYMRDCVDKSSGFLSEIIKQGIADGSLVTGFPDECAEVFLLLLNVWCDPAVFACTMEKLEQRLRFLQHTMKSIGIDVLNDTLLERTLDLLEKIYMKEGEAGE